MQLGNSMAAALLVIAVVAAASGDAGAQAVDVEQIFWCDAARDPEKQDASACAASRGMVLQLCTSCHTFVPIVKSQKQPEEWGATMGVHRERMPDLTDDDAATIQRFLAARFNPANEPPKLPPELEALGTQQAN